MASKIDLNFLDKDFEKRYYNTVKTRFQLMQLCSKDKRVRAACIQRASEDVIFFCNMFVFTFNPRVTPSVIPFILFPRQEELILFIEGCLNEKKWGEVTKCRYTGASYVTCMYLLHKLMFAKDFSGSLSSNKADSVDKIGDPDCLFEKIIMMYRWLPEWLKTFDIEAGRKLKLLTNPANNTQIKGYSGKDIGRGGRSTLAVVDESAHLEQGFKALAALSENTDCALMITTPTGTSSMHYSLHVSSEVKSFMYKWDADPRRNFEWYEAQIRKLGQEIAEQELNCNYFSAVEGALIKPAWIRACVTNEIPITDEPSKYNPGTIYAGLDVAKTRDRSVLCIRRGNKVLHIQQLPKNEVTQTCLLVHEILIEWGVDIFVYDSLGLGSDVKGILDLQFPTHPYEIRLYSSSHSAGEDYLEAYDELAKDRFYNLRAYTMYQMRTRIKNTHDFVNKIREVDMEKTIVFPQDTSEDCLNDFCKPTALFKGKKLLIESKEDLKKRGVSSTDYFDAVVMAFYDGEGADYLEAMYG